MLIDRLKLAHLINNLMQLPATNMLISNNSELMVLIEQVKCEYDNIAGLSSVVDDITNDVMSTNLMPLIGSVKNILVGIREQESRKITSSNKNMMNVIHYVIENNPCDNEYSELIPCTKCEGSMIYEGKYLRCNSCDMIQYNNVDNFNLDNAGNFDANNNNRNSNIIKHLHKNLSHIYGESWPDKLLEAVGDIICRKIRKRLPNLAESVHPSYEVHEFLHNLKYIRHEEKYYMPKNYKIFANSFIVKAFPDIKIRKLDAEDHELLYNSFLGITAEFLNIITQKTVGKISKYNNNYSFTIHRILYMKLGYKNYILDLLKFIYIQSPSSFGNKDKKLRKVDNKIKCFAQFYDTPIDIYINDRYYSTSFERT